MRRKVLILLLTTVIGLCTQIVWAETHTDAEIKDIIVRSGQFEDNPRMAKNLFTSAFRAAETNRVRFARLLCELAYERAGDATWLLQRVGEYGAETNLPFLFSCATNPAIGRAAIGSALRIGGLTSNAFEAVGMYLCNTNVAIHLREDLCVDMIRVRNDSTIEPSLDSNVVDCAYRFFQQDPFYDEWYDRRVQKLLPDYEFSKRRLSVLRSVQSLGLNQYNEHFVTNAINKLVAYPEANLPD
jgi:hypothetical protein